MICSFKSIINYIRDDKTNIVILNYMVMIYLGILLVSYKIDSKFIYLIIFTFLLNRNLKERLCNTFKNRFVQACISFFTVCLFWLVLSENIEYGLFNLKLNKIYLYPIFFVAIIRKEFFGKYICVFLTLMFLNVIWSYLMYFDLVNSPFMRDVGLPLLHKTDHGYFVMIALAYVLYRLLTAKTDKIYIKALLIIYSLMESANIFITNNKTSMVSLLILLFVLLLCVYKDSLLKILVVFGLFTIFVFSLLNFALPNVKNLLIHEYTTSYKAITEKKYIGSMAIRIGIAHYAIEAICENYLLGVGTGGHALATIKKVEVGDLKKSDPHSYNGIISNIKTGKGATLHNTYLQVYLQFGIIGFFIFLNIFIQLLRYVKNSNSVSGLLILVMVISMGLNFSTGWDFQFGNLGKFFMVFISILISNINQHTRNLFNEKE